MAIVTKIENKEVETYSTKIIDGKLYFYPVGAKKMFYIDHFVDRFEREKENCERRHNSPEE